VPTFPPVDTHRRSETPPVDSYDAAALGIEVRIDGRQVIVAVAGYVDITTAPMLGGVVEAVADRRATDLILDLDSLSFMDAAGLRVLVAARVRLSESDGMFVLRHVPANVLRLLQVTRLDSELVIETAGEVMAAIGAAAEPMDLPVPRGIRTIDDGLDLVAALAAATVEGADGASVTLQRGGRLVTVASTDDTMLRADHHQYATGEGPCVAAATEGTGFHMSSVATEDRWPAFVPLAAGEGIAAIMSTPLISSGKPVGALNIYSNAHDAFGASQGHVAELLAAQGSGIVSAIDGGTEHRRRTTDALLEREVIAQAQGVLMGRHHIGASQADGALHRGARSAERTVHAEALWVLSSISAPSVDGEVSGP